MRMLRLLCLACLLLLTGCGVLAQMPPDQAVRLAIAQQLTDTQQTLATELGIPNPKPNFQVKKLDVRSRQKLTEPAYQRYPGEVYRVRGTFEAVLTSPEKKEKIEQESPFEVYLSINPQDDSEIETWFFIRPDPASDSI
ncbi:MAG: hypothetical protein WA885_07600 [Phormidesmis sp.]